MSIFKYLSKTRATSSRVTMSRPITLERIVAFKKRGFDRVMNLYLFRWVFACSVESFSFRTVPMEYRDSTVETANVTLEQNKSNFRASSIVTFAYTLEKHPDLHWKRFLLKRAYIFYEIYEMYYNISYYTFLVGKHTTNLQFYCNTLTNHRDA